MKRSLLWISIGFQAVYVIPSVISVIQYSQMINPIDKFTSVVMRGNIIGTIIHILAFYLFYLILSPKLLYRRKIKAFVMYAVAAAVVSTAIAISFALYGTHHTTHSAYPYWFVYSVGLNTLLTGMIACAMRGFINWLAERHYRGQLEKKNVETQLALLKAQINPHFLFNTLNNIDVLIGKDPQKASAYLQKLSGILRFMLYENTDEKIVLSKEVAYITEYIELQKIRTANPGFISFEVQGNTSHAMIAPMLFIPFIENAFKHSTNKKIDKGIDVLIKADDNQIKFTCINAYDEAAMQTQEHSGLGLELIRNRLDLLYKNHYTIDLDKTSDQFSVTLTININGN